MAWSRIGPNRATATVAGQTETRSIKAFLKNLFSTARALPEKMTAKLSSYREGVAAARQQVAEKAANGHAPAAPTDIHQPVNAKAHNPLKKYRAMFPNLQKQNPFAAPELRAKALVPFAKNSPLKVSKASQDLLLDAKAALNRILDTAPSAMKKQPGWENFRQRMEIYLDVTKDLQGRDFVGLLNTPGLDFKGLLGSLRMYSAMDDDTARKMSFERDLANVTGHRIREVAGLGGTNEELNGSVLGCERSYISAHPDSKVAKPGNQVSLETDTILRRADGTVCKVTIMSCSAPALDSSEQPEWNQYVDANGALKKNEYQKAIDTLKEHILMRADNPTCRRAVLTGIGTRSFLTGLKSEKDKAAAISMVAQALAEVAMALHAKDKSVGFYDLDEKLCARINGLTNNTPTITFLGKLETSWEQDGDLILNAWDPNSLLGNGLQQDRSGDGIIGRHTLIHFQHAMACALYAEGML